MVPPSQVEAGVGVKLVVGLSKITIGLMVSPTHPSDETICRLIFWLPVALMSAAGFCRVDVTAPGNVQFHWAMLKPFDEVDGEVK